LGPDPKTHERSQGQDDRAAIGISEHHEAPPRGVLGRPENRKPALRRLPLALVGILDGEPHGRPADTAACGEDAPLVVTPVVAVQHHAARRAAHDDDDVILEHHGQPQAANVEGPRLLEVGDEQNQALKAERVHTSRIGPAAGPFGLAHATLVVEVMPVRYSALADVERHSGRAVSARDGGC